MQLRDLFIDSPLGQGGVTPIELQRLINSDLDVLTDWRRTEGLLLDACERLPRSLEPHIALYKMYAYANRFEDALAQIDYVLTQAAAQGGFGADWTKLNAKSADWNHAQGPLRHYLYSLKALGFVRLRQGRIDEARRVLTRLCTLDPEDQVGGSVVLGMAERLMEDAAEAAS